MKILHLIDSGGLYGAERMLLALVAEQIKSGLEPMILSAGDFNVPEKAIELEAKKNDIPILPWRMKPGLNIVEAINIVRWANEQGYQLFHSHGYKFNVLLGVLPRKIKRLPVVTTVHGYVFAKKFTKSWFYEITDKFLLREIDKIILVTKHMEKLISDTGISQDKVTVIPNGLDVDRVCKKISAPIDEVIEDFFSRFSPIILAVGRLSEEKGFNILIDGFVLLKKHFPEAGMIIVGDGPKRNDLQLQITRLELSDSILMPGYIEEVIALMSRSDVLCMPSKTEGLPITLLEALYVGIPVVAASVGEVPDVLGWGNGGILLDAVTQNSVKNSLLSCLTNDDSVYNRSQWAKKHVIRYYTSSVMSASYLKIYRSLPN